MKISKS